MNRIRKILLMGILLMTLVAWTTGCKKEAVDGKSTTPQVLTIANVDDLGSMNPHLYDSDMGGQSLVYEPLVNLDKKGNIVPWLAKSWDIQDNGCKIIMKLREDVKFTDGNVFNANVVKQNFDAILSNAKRHSWLPSIDKLMQVDVVDEYTVAFYLKDPYPHFLLELTMIRPVRLLSPGGFGADGKTFEKPIGTGPFILNEYVRDEKAVFVRNDNYWGNKPKLEKLIIRPVPDSNTRLMALMAGEVDLIKGVGMSAVSYLDLDNLKGNKDLTVLTKMGDSAQFLVINPNVEPLNDKMVREAVALAVDNSEINKAAFAGKEKPAETIFSPRIPEIAGKAVAPKKDKKKAAELLAQAGWKDTNGDGYLEKDGKTLEFMCNIRSAYATQKVLAETLQSQLKDIGIKMIISAVEDATYYERKNNEEKGFGVMVDETWGIQYDPQSIFKSFQGRPCLSVVFTGETLAKFEQVQVTMDQNQRRELNDEIADILMNKEYVVIPLTVITNVAVCKNKVKGFEFPPYAYDLGRCLTNVYIEK
jgi:nickel transport system substrate-binding protein